MAIESTIYNRFWQISTFLGHNGIYFIAMHDKSTYGPAQSFNLHNYLTRNDITFKIWLQVIKLFWCKRMFFLYNYVNKTNHSLRFEIRHVCAQCITFKDYYLIKHCFKDKLNVLFMIWINSMSKCPYFHNGHAS